MRALFRLLLPGPLPRVLGRIAAAGAAARQPAEAMRALLEIDADLQNRLDRAAVEYGGGVHVKHRLMRYHDFFVERVAEGERVLDIGCGKGELAHDLAARAGALVTGIDVNPAYLRFARDRFRHPNLEFVEADALAYVPDSPFDVVVLSNVLEHIEDRVTLLRRIVANARPQRLLIRVPVYNRHWHVPLRAELGLFPFSDATHHVEYLPDGFVAELAEAGLGVEELVVTWGEIWAVVRPA